MKVEMTAEVTRITGKTGTRNSSRVTAMKEMIETIEMIATTGMTAMIGTAAERITTRKTGSNKTASSLQTLAVNNCRGFLLLQHPYTKHLHEFI